MHINYIEEFDKTLSEADKKTRKRFLVYRSNPGDPNDQPKFMSYYIDLANCKKMYLDALIKIKDEMDSTLTFRR
jgi:succinate dehydrogenase/fumarate reductase-like Fe-S protein